MIKLITATLEDLDEIILLENKAYLPYLEFLSRKPRVLRMTKSNWKEFLNKKQIYIYKDDEKIIAAVTLKVRNAEELDLSRLAILPDYQNRGIGTAIIEWAEKKAKLLNKDMNLAAYGKNKSLCTFYTNRGYTIAKRFVHKDEEIVVFKKKLS